MSVLAGLYGPGGGQWDRTPSLALSALSQGPECWALGLASGEERSPAISLTAWRGAGVSVTQLCPRCTSPVLSRWKGKFLGKFRCLRVAPGAPVQFPTLTSTPWAGC